MSTARASLLWLAGVAGVAVGCGRVSFDLRGDGGHGDRDGGPDDGALDDGGPGDDAAEATPNRAFITSQAYVGDLGGLAGADAQCQARAQAAGLSGTYIALLATPSTASVARLGAARGWVDLTGRPIADKAEHWIGRLIYPLRVNELGDAVAAPVGILRGEAGLTPDRSCAGWTLPSGGLAWQTLSTEPQLTSTYSNCNQAARLLCLETRAAVPVAAPQTSGRLAFVTRATWTTTGGLASADALCQSEAAAATRPGSFRAVLWSSGQAPATRFSLAGPTWVRADGVALAPTAAAVFGPDDLDAFAHLTADGEQVGTSWTFYTVARGTAAEDCGNWTTTGGNLRLALTASVRRARFDGADTTNNNVCGNPFRLLCLQE